MVASRSNARSGPPVVAVNIHVCLGGVGLSLVTSLFVTSLFVASVSPAGELDAGTVVSVGSSDSSGVADVGSPVVCCGELVDGALVPLGFTLAEAEEFVEAFVVVVEELLPTEVVVESVAGDEPVEHAVNR